MENDNAAAKAPEKTNRELTKSGNERLFPFFDVPTAAICKRCFLNIVCGPSIVSESTISTEFARAVGRPRAADEFKNSDPRARRTKTKAVAAALIREARADGNYDPTSTTGAVHLPWATQEQLFEYLKKSVG